MATMDFVEVVKLDQRNLKDRKVINVTENNIIRDNRYNFLIILLETYNKKEYKNNERITEYIICNLPVENEEKAHEQWFEGIEYEGYTYKAWFATTGGMKKEGFGICDTIFIREDYQDFAQMVEKLISLGKFTQLEKEEREICINKDVLSRLSLMTSNLITEIDMPHTIILKNSTLDWIREYKTVQPIKTITTKKKGEEVETVDYKLVDYHFNTLENEQDEIEIFDGYGLGTPKVFKKIGQSLNRDDIEFAVIRGYSNATKGLITKFDILGYMKEFYQSDTDYCRKINGQFQLKDRWGDWQTVTDNTILLNNSMVKLAKMFASFEEYQEKLNSLNTNTCKDYYNMLNKLYITKVNTPESKINDYRRTNYQLINALALTPQNYKELMQEDLKLFTKLVKPYTFKEDTAEFVENTDYINLFYKNIAKSEDEEDIYEACENVVDKTSELININQEFVKLNYVKLNLASLIEKKVREMASGKITVKGKYQYMACCPISYMNFVMTGDQGDNGLDKGQFYSGDCQNGDIRTISRNPLAAYSEVHNVKFIKNELLDKYLSKSKELIYFNQKSDIQNLLSGADFDGDGVTQIDNQIIRDAVVTPDDEKYFVNVSDGDTKTLIYNKENRFISTYRASGNLIGKIALKSASINSNCQRIHDYYDTKNSKFLIYKDMKKHYIDKFGNDEGLKEFIADKIHTGHLIYSYQADEQLREKMTKEFYENEKDIYIVLYNTMKAIDASKTLVFPDRADLKVVDEKYFKKADFLQYTERKENVDDGQYIFTGGLIDKFAGQIQRKLINDIEVRKTKFSSRHELLQKEFANDEYVEDTCRLAKEEIEQLYESYNTERKEAENLCKSKNKELWADRNYRQEVMQSWSQHEENWYWQDREKNRKERINSYKNIDNTYIVRAEEIIAKYGLVNVCQAISQMERCTENFIINLFWKCFNYVNSKEDRVRYTYIEDDKGDIEYMYKKYIKVPISNFDNSNVVERLATKEKIQRGIEQKVRFRLLDNSIIVEIEESLERGQVYELKIDDERIEMFPDFVDVLADRETVNVKNFEIKKDGKMAITEKSFGVIIEAKGLQGMGHSTLFHVLLL